MKKIVFNRNTAISAAIDFVSVVLGFVFAVLLVGSVGPTGTLPSFFTWFPLNAIVAAVFEFTLLWVLKMLTGEWKSPDLNCVIRLSAATVISFVLTYLFALICGFDIAVSVYIVALFITVCMMLAARVVLAVISGQTAIAPASDGQDGGEETEQTPVGRDNTGLTDEAVESMLGKEPVDPAIERVFAAISGKTILVTGGAGTVGKELCRQIAAYSPSRLILLDSSENSAYNVGSALKAQFPKLALDVVVGNIGDSEKIDALFSKYRPQIVFHAAAYNQAQLMEENPDEAIKNNVFGTLNAAQAADKFGVESFMLLSTEKAVRPISMVGVSKQLCESVIRMYANHSKTKFSAVRFGNVLGSNRNVVSIFGKQILSGGPVTVTDRNASRYIISSGDAASLILRAFTVAETGKVYAIFSGDQVNIYDLAVKMSMLAGYTPDVDISIRITGLRKNEKLSEELTYGEPIKTEDEMIFADTLDELDEKAFLHTLTALRSASGDEVKKIAAEAVSSYVPD